MDDKKCDGVNNSTFDYLAYHQERKDTVQKNEKDIQTFETDENRKILRKTKTKINYCSWQLIGILAGSLVHLATGVMVGLTGIILPSLLNPQPGEMYISENQAYIFSSIVSGGAIAGSAISGPLMVWLGQRVCLLIFLPIAIICWIIIAFAQSFWLLLGSRFASGILVGLGTVCTNNYVLEITHTNLKGRGVAVLDFGRQTGYLFVYLVGSTKLSWRNISLACGLPSCIIPFILFFLLHDSPRWLGIKGNREDVEHSLQFFRGKNADISSELDGIVMQKSKAGKGVWDQLKIITHGYILKVLILSIYLSFASHFTGNLISVMYSATIFKTTNTGINEYISTIIMGSSRIAGTVVYIFFADKFPKRLLLTVPLLLTAFCMVILGGFFYFQHIGADMEYVFWLPLLTIIIYGFLTCIALPVMMILRSELIPNSVRPIAVSILFVVFNTAAFISTQSFPYLIELIGSHWTYWIFAINNIMIVIIVLIFIPETQGKSLEEIEDILRKGLGPKIFSHTKN